MDSTDRPERNIRLNLEYDGTRFCGSQIQPKLPTVQGELEKAIEKMTGRKIKIKQAGRTDAGVHAHDQVVNFRLVSDLPVEAFLKGLNSLLPPDIAVRNAGEVPLDFDARRSAKAKLYRYLIHNQEQRRAIGRQYHWHVKQPLDLEAMNKAAKYLIGSHDFSSFRSSSCEAKHPIREIEKIQITRSLDSVVTIEVQANAFLKQMVRTIVGTLVEVGRKRISPEDMKTILEAKDRNKAGPTAPPQGLCLVRVYY